MSTETPPRPQRSPTYPRTPQTQTPNAEPDRWRPPADDRSRGNPRPLWAFPVDPADEGR